MIRNINELHINWSGSLFTLGNGHKCEMYIFLRHSTLLPSFTAACFKTIFHIRHLVLCFVKIVVYGYRFYNTSSVEDSEKAMQNVDI
jgi:hypothetical protein